MNDYELCYSAIVLKLTWPVLNALDVFLKQSSSYFLRLLTQFRIQGLCWSKVPIQWQQVGLVDFGTGNTQSLSRLKINILPLHWHTVCHGSDAITAKYMDIQLCSVSHEEKENIISISFIARKR
jgi:hypothetical protein